MIPAIILGIFALLFIWLEMHSTIRAEKVKSEWEAGTNFTADFLYNALEKSYDPSDNTNMFRPHGEVVQMVFPREMHQ